MTGCIRVNKEYRIYVHEAEQKKETASKSPSNIKYYPCYYISPVFYGNPYYSLVL